MNTKQPKAAPKAKKPKQVFECEYCKKHYVKESAFLQHTCRAKERLDQIKTPLGQAAYLFYAKWMFMTKRSVPSRDTFMTSKYYESMIRFAKFIKAVRIPEPEIYIQVMKSKDLQPTMWTLDDAYGFYLEHVEFHMDPKTSIRITSSIISELAQEYEVDMPQVFEAVEPNEIIQLIRERKLTPWVLLKSAKFRQFLQSCTDEQMSIIETLINSTFWKRRFQDNPKVVEFVKQCNEIMGI